MQDPTPSFLTLFNAGILEGIVLIWLKAWGFPFVVAFPTVILVSPLVGKLVALVIVDEDHR